MLEALLRGLVAALAAAGATTLLRAARTGVRLALRAAEVTASTGLAEVSARRGDLTGLRERRAAAATARAERRREALRLLLWAAWLLLPLAAGWAPAAYAAAAPLWLLRLPAVRPQPEPSPPED